MTALLEARRLVFSHTERPFIADLSLAVEAGCVIGIAGPNGAGKTTLMNLMAGLLRPVAGEVLLTGRPLEAIRRKAIARKMALIPPEAPAPFAYTVRDVVEMGRYPHLDAFRPLGAADRAAVGEAIRRTGLNGFEEKSYNRLSSGERQRVVIARALAQTPRVLLMDEPTVHLDIRYQVEIHELMRAMAGEAGLAILVITHDLNLAARYCDRIVLMAEGRILRSGAPVEVLETNLLEHVYHTPLDVHPHPRTGRPTVWPRAQ